ncbi:MAG TPA: endonuclease III [Candidatus Dormibacteraeota bacterium]|nr:endonuclease III [Candidatus Dormibacteraeota bacterium]
MARPYGARQRALRTVARLKEVYDARCELDFETPYQLLIATILSAQSTDRTVNSVTPKLFARWPAPADLAAADPAEVEALIKPTGFFREKTRSITGAAAAITERHRGQVPPRMEEMVKLPGVGRKTANVVLGVAFGIPGFAVDTHVTRLSGRLGLTDSSDPVKIERDVCEVVPKQEWTDLSLRLILHGRRVCDARRPNCDACVLNDFCPSSSTRAANKRSTLAANAGSGSAPDKRRVPRAAV